MQCVSLLFLSLGALSAYGQVDPIPAATTVAPTAPQTFIVLLEGEPAASAFLKLRQIRTVSPANAPSAAPDAAQAARDLLAQIKSQQDSFIAKLKPHGIAEFRHYGKLLNAVSIVATPGQATEVAGF